MKEIIVNNIVIADGGLGRIPNGYFEECVFLSPTYIINEQYCYLHCSHIIIFIQCGHTIMTAAPLFGTYSTYTLCPAGTPVVALPSVITPTLAAPINCALATMVNALSKLPATPSPGRPGASVALVQVSKSNDITKKLNYLT